MKFQFKPFLKSNKKLIFLSVFLATLITSLIEAKIKSIQLHYENQFEVLEVFILKEDLSKNQNIHPDHLHLLKIPKPFVPKYAVLKDELNQLSSYYSPVPQKAGNPLLWNYLIHKDHKHMEIISVE